LTKSSCPGSSQILGSNRMTISVAKILYGRLLFIVSACLTVALIDEVNIKPTRWIRVEISHNPVCGNIASSVRADRSRAPLFRFSTEEPPARGRDWLRLTGPGVPLSEEERGARRLFSRVERWGLMPRALLTATQA